MIIDVSRHQGKIDWDKLAPHVDFAIIKATGDLYNSIDPWFHVNARACIERNIPLHVFHFTRAHSADEARKEARFFVETARQYDPLSYVLDLEGETLGNRNVTGIAQAFMAELRTHGVRKIGLYTGHFAYMGYGLDVIDRDYLWIARYGDKNDGNRHISRWANKISLSAQNAQLYTPSASILDDKREILFPTVYNPDDSTERLCCIILNGDQCEFKDIDTSSVITSDVKSLYFGSGLVNIGLKTYAFYETRNADHEHFVIGTTKSAIRRIEVTDTTIPDVVRP